MILLLLGMLCAYLVGSIPTSYIAGQWIKGIDLREHGSGNLGATNVNRTLGPKWGFTVLFLDMLKGLLSVTLLYALFPAKPYAYDLVKVLYGFAAIAGHIWTVFLSFKGGKGVATSAGVFVALSAPATLSAAVVCIGLIALTRYVSLGSIAAAIALPVGMALFSDSQLYLMLAMIISAVVVGKHKANVRRLILGQENKISFKKGAQ